MESRSAGCATATGVAVRMQPDKASAAVTAMIGSRNARATRTGTIPQSETTLVLHRLWLTNHFLELSPCHPVSLTEIAASIFGLSQQLEIESLFRHGRACPGHPRLSCLSEVKTWMPGTRPGTTSFSIRALFHELHFESDSEEREARLKGG